MSTRLAELAQLVEGHLTGGGKTPIEGAAPLAEAGPATITFIDNADKIKHLDTSQAAAAVVPRGCVTRAVPCIEVDDVRGAFAKLVRHFRPRRTPRRRGWSPVARICHTAQIAENVEIGPGSVIGDEVEIGSGATIHAGVHIMAGCRIAENVTIFPGAVLYEDTRVGPRCIIHSGAVLGAYGFGYDSNAEGHTLTPQLGWVELGADVEVGANSTIDRGTFGATSIGAGTKIDNQVQVGHNCRIGRNNLLCAQVGIAGSTSTGDYVVMAGQVGVKDHAHIGEGAILAAMCGIISDVEPGTTMAGVPATPLREQKLKQAALAKLPEMRREFRKLQARVAELSTQLMSTAGRESLPAREKDAA